MPKRMETCAAAKCSVRYLPTRSGCGGRQRIVQSYFDHARALLKPDAAVGDWICTIHRNKLRQCVENAVPQDMVRCDRGLTLAVHISVRVVLALCQKEGSERVDEAAAAATLARLQRDSKARSTVRLVFPSLRSTHGLC
jgi:hypothetical protein